MSAPANYSVYINLQGLTIVYYSTPLKTKHGSNLSSWIHKSVMINWQQLLQAWVYFLMCEKVCTQAYHTSFFTLSLKKISWCVSHVLSRTWLSPTVVSYICDLLTSIYSNQVTRCIFRYSSSVPVRWGNSQVKFWTAALNEDWIWLLVCVCLSALNRK